MGQSTIRFFRLPESRLSPVVLGSFPLQLPLWEAICTNVEVRIISLKNPLHLWLSGFSMALRAIYHYGLIFFLPQVTKPCTVWYRMRNDTTFFHYDFYWPLSEKRIKASTSCKILLRVQLSQNSWSLSQHYRDASRSLLHFSSNNVGDPEWLRRRKRSVSGLPGNHSYVSISWSSCFQLWPWAYAQHICHLSSV